MLSLLFVPALLASCLLVDAQSDCRTPNGADGRCINVYNCKDLVDLYKDTTKAYILRNSLCGLDGNTPMVCCPLNEIRPSQCSTPDGVPGTCMNIDSCPHLAKLAQEQTSLSYVQQTRCEGTEQFVCCGSDPAVSGSATPKSGGCTLTATPPDPSTGCCGLDGAGGNRIVGGNSTFIDQYPWISLIEFRKQKMIQLICGGALISGTYVVTAAHCVVGPDFIGGAVVNVRLGEYDVSNKGRDCVDVEGGGQDCTDGAIIIPIKRIIVHPEYNPNSKLKRNDIALIELSQTVKYTDFVRPICLPRTDFTETSKTGSEKLFVAGWGAVSETQTYSTIKLHVDVPFMSIASCQRYYSMPKLKIPLWDGQMCAGGVIGKDSCRGDSGGPLMRENGKLQELVGIVSMGAKPCGVTKIPAVYTKVFQYLPWIKSQIGY